MNLADVLETADTRQVAAEFAYTARAMVHVCRLALVNDAFGDSPERRMGEVETVLDAAEALLMVVSERVEGFERELKLGIRARMGLTCDPITSESAGPEGDGAAVNS